MTSSDAESNALICTRHGTAVAFPQEGAGAAVQVLAGLRCDLVRAPVDVCCGVFDDLSRRTTRSTPAILQVGHSMLFFVRPGSAAAVLADESLAAGLAALGLQASDDVRLLCGAAALSDAQTWWVVPPAGGDPHIELPSARTVVEAIQTGYAIFGPKEGA